MIRDWWQHRKQRQKLIDDALIAISEFRHGPLYVTTPTGTTNVKLDQNFVNDFRQTLADIRALAEILAKANITQIPNDKLPPNLRQ